MAAPWPMTWATAAPPTSPRPDPFHPQPAIDPQSFAGHRLPSCTREAVALAFVASGTGWSGPGEHKGETGMKSTSWSDGGETGPEELEYLGTVDAVARLTEEEFGPGKTWPWTWARRADMAECIIDAVFSVRARSVDVDRILDRWRHWQMEQGIASVTPWDLAVALRNLPGLTGAGPVRVVEGEPAARRPVFPRNRIAGRLKTTIAEEVATVLDDAGIVGMEDFRGRLLVSPMALRNEWLRVHGLGETSFCHMRLLAGSDVLDPGVRVLRFLGLGRAVPVPWAKDVILGVADAMDVPPVAVEYALSLLAARAHVRPKKRGVGGRETAATSTNADGREPAAKSGDAGGGETEAA